MDAESIADIINEGKKPKTNNFKLNVPRTILVGLAFLSISMFWQVYDNLMPLFLADFNLGETLSGFIMALDNILAIFLLPFMGLLSDRFPLNLRNRIGRRIPFIVTGSILASFTFLLVNFAHNQRVLSLMMVSTAFLLIFMCLYRTPAVALMPDVTPKEIRSQGNTVINIMGTIGGVVSLILMNIFLKKEQVNINGQEITKLIGNNWIIIGIICGLMILTALIMLIKVKENKFVEDKNKILREKGFLEEKADEVAAKKGRAFKILGNLDKYQRTSLIFILVSVALWYMAYNAVNTWFSRFAFEELALKDFTLPLLIANASAFIMFVPSSLIGKKIGRKNTVLIGVGLMLTAFLLGTILIYFTSKDITKIGMYPVFILVGAGWATINVHSFVMSVEMANEGETGAYTGLYYSFAMGAQIITPVLSGALIENVSFKMLMPYALIFTLLAFITMTFVRHGNSTDNPIKVRVKSK